MKTTLLLTIFLIPLLGATNYLGYEQIKVLFFILSISLIGFVWVWKKPDLKWDLIRIISAVFILMLFIASVFGIDLKASFFGREPYFQGWILYAYLFLFALIASQAKIKLEHWAAVLTGSSMFVGLTAIKDWILMNIFGQQMPAYAGRVVSTFGQPNFYAGFLLLVLPFSYYLFKNKDKKLSYFGGVAGLISIIGILVSYSRLAILLALLLLALGLIAQLKGKFKIGLIVFGVIGVSIFIALKFSSGIIENEISLPLETLNPDLTRESVEKRAYIWPVAFQILLREPLTGYGLENIGKAFSNYFEVNKHPLFEENLKISPVLISLKELNIDRSHSYILDLLLFSGAAGLLAWIFLVCLLFLKLTKNTKYPTVAGKNVLLVALATYLVWVQFQNQSVVHLIYFWLLAGLIGEKLLAE